MAAPRGKDAKARPGEIGGILRGARLQVSMSPPQAVASAVAQLTAQGFDVRDRGEGAQLAAQASPWIVAAVEIGDARKSRRSEMLSVVLEDSVLDFLPALRPALPPVMVIAAARALPGGSTELQIAPHRSRSGSDKTNLVAPRVTAAIEAIRTDPRAGVTVFDWTLQAPDSGSPASDAAARELFGWR